MKPNYILFYCVLSKRIAMLGRPSTAMITWSHGHIVTWPHGHKSNARRVQMCIELAYMAVLPLTLSWVTWIGFIVITFIQFVEFEAARIFIINHVETEMSLFLQTLINNISGTFKISGTRSFFVKDISCVGGGGVSGSMCFRLFLSHRKEKPSWLARIFWILGDNEGKTHTHMTKETLNV